MTKILIFSGSTRTGSLNTRLATAAAAIAVEAGAKATLLDLRDYPAAIYQGDDEAENGVPTTMRALKKLMAQYDRIIVVSPEYNGHVPPLLVNTFSWLSRSEAGDNGLVALQGKKAAIMAASPGRLGGVRVIPRLRDMLAELGVTVVPGFVTLPQAGAAFDEHGNIKDEKTRESLKSMVEKLLQA